MKQPNVYLINYACRKWTTCISYQQVFRLWIVACSITFRRTNVRYTERISCQDVHRSIFDHQCYNNFRISVMDTDLLILFHNSSAMCGVVQSSQISHRLCYTLNEEQLIADLRCFLLIYFGLCVVNLYIASTLKSIVCSAGI